MKKYQNLEPQQRPGFFDILKWKWRGEPKRWPRWVENRTVPQLPHAVAEGEAHLTFVNHSTVLIQLPGLNLITDPVFSKRVGPFASMGPRRVRDPGIALHELPKIDVVVLSHNHYDHLDLATLHWIEKRDRPLHLVPLGNGKWLKRVERVVELDWWDSETLKGGQVITLTPAHHWSRRGLFDDCAALWGGFVIQANGVQLFFAGDTGYSTHFQLVRERFGKMDVALIPIGAYEPRWVMKQFHIDPSEAVVAHEELGAELSLGIHFGTFQLTDEAIDDPVILLKYHLAQKQIDPKTFIAPDHGETIVFEKSRKGVAP